MATISPFACSRPAVNAAWWTKLREREKIYILEITFLNERNFDRLVSVLPSSTKIISYSNVIDSIAATVLLTSSFTSFSSLNTGITNDSILV